ncbi:hypothetical protein EA187_16770 [Lujinxingia sediminis]|uniref:Uncharacterized protein n=1 Tax=Lujinxingia sediminis TaxID=2480984 RepID=A0ABY0CQ97_9DELT|nr:hypothetical protein [Lujinxingia sediminis]RVU42240.1 hypothetical protein EA187_16770 [Lujinxingia sediminis]
MSAPQTQKQLVAALIWGGALLTSGCGQEPRGVEGLGEPEETQVSVYNRTHDVVPLHVQPLRSELVVDCELVSGRISEFLRNEHLMSSISIERLYSGQETRLYSWSSSQGSAGCRLSVVRTSDGRVADVAVSWPFGLATKSFYRDVDAPADIPTGENTVVLTADYSETPLSERRTWRSRPCSGELSTCTEAEQAEALSAPAGAVYAWEVVGDEVELSSWEGTSILETPLSEAVDQGSCSTGIAGSSLRWSYPPSEREWQVLSVHPSDEAGCYDVALQSPAEDRNWQICGSERLASRLAPNSDLNPLFVQFFVDIAAPNGDGEVTYANISIDLRRENQNGDILEVETIDVVRGYSLPSHLALDYSTRLSEGCEVTRESSACLQISAPLTLALATSTGTLDVVAGETVALGSESSRRLELVRGMHRAVVDQGCSDDLTGLPGIDRVGPYLEIVYYSGVSTFDE